MTHSTVRYKRVPDFPNYLVGTNGSVWSKNRKGQWDGERGRKKWKRIKTRPHPQHKYVMVRLCHKGKYKGFLLHRLVLLTFVGPPPDGCSEGCHKNDVPDDNRLENLYWGSRSQNMQDAIRNGRTTQGEKNDRAKLTEEQVKEIIRLRAEEGIGSRRLARKFGVCPQAIQLILSGINWKHVGAVDTEITREDTIRGSRNPAAKLTEEQVRLIRKYYAEGSRSQQSLAEQFGVAQGMISMIILRKTWSHVR